MRLLLHVAVFWGTLCLITLPSKLDAVAIWGGIAVIAALVADRVLRTGGAGFRPRAAWLARAALLPGRVLADTWLLARRLAGGAAGESRFEGVPFPSAGDDARAATRRALAEAAAGVAPNVFALGLDREEEVLVVHQLVPRDDLDHAADPLRLR